MKSYLIESLSPLVFRAGKPFGSQASAQDVIFPLPSAAAGLVRYLHLSQNTDGKAFQFTKKDFDAYQKEVLSIKSVGPFLVKFSDENDIQILVPKPANALYFEDKATGKKSLVCLSPKAFDGEENELCGSDLPEGLFHVQMEEDLKGKPAQGVKYWTLEHFIQWQNGTTLDFETVNKNGLSAIPTELRTHVAIDDNSRASQDGMLFQTASFDLSHQKTENGWEKERLGFLVQTTEELQTDLAAFGGERRLSHFKPVKNVSLPFASTQNAIKKGFSLAFITPCIFKNGALPAWINEIKLGDKKILAGTIPNTAIQVQLKAMAIERWQAVSGWDSVLWKPKATRKAIPAGSVYWFEILEGKLDSSALEELSNRVWSDNEYDRYDGFGSAILSAW